MSDQRSIVIQLKKRPIVFTSWNYPNWHFYCFLPVWSLQNPIDKLHARNVSMRRKKEVGTLQHVRHFLCLFSRIFSFLFCEWVDLKALKTAKAKFASDAVNISQFFFLFTASLPDKMIMWDPSITIMWSQLAAAYRMPTTGVNGVDSTPVMPCHANHANLNMV